MTQNKRGAICYPYADNVCSCIQQKKTRNEMKSLFCACACCLTRTCTNFLLISSRNHFLKQLSQTECEEKWIVFHLQFSSWQIVVGVAWAQAVCQTGIHWCWQFALWICRKCGSGGTTTTKTLSHSLFSLKKMNYLEVILMYSKLSQSQQFIYTEQMKIAAIFSRKISEW